MKHFLFFCQDSRVCRVNLEQFISINNVNETLWGGVCEWGWGLVQIFLTPDMPCGQSNVNETYKKYQNTTYLFLIKTSVLWSFILCPSWHHWLSTCQIYSRKQKTCSPIFRLLGCDKKAESKFQHPMNDKNLLLQFILISKKMNVCN